MRGARRERGAALLAVLLVVVLASLVAATMLDRARGHNAVSSMELSSHQAESAANAGIRVVAAELDRQTRESLRGIEPSLNEEYELFEVEGRRYVVRLREVDGRLAQPEAARLNINVATKAMLEGIGLTGEQAEAVIDRRSKRPWSSVLDLVGEGVIELDALLAARSGAEGGSAGAMVDVLTTLSFDPAVRSGVGVDVGLGEARVRFVEGEIEAVLALAEELLGPEDVARFFGGFAQSAEPSLADAVLRLSDDSLRGGVYDAFTEELDLFTPGLIDVNRAGVEVLAVVPGIGAETAQKIVERRESVATADRGSPMWLLEGGLLDEAAFLEAIPWLTTRTMQWRVVVETGYVLEEGGALVGEGESLDGRGGEALMDKRVREVVVDVSGDVVRIAALRDVTLREIAEGIRGALVEEDVEGLASLEELERAALDASLSLDEFVEASGIVVGGDEDGIEGEGGGGGDGVRSSAERAADRRDARRAARDARREARSSSGSSGRGVERPARDEPPERNEVRPPAPPPPPPADNRTGRWTDGPGGSG